MLSKVKTRIMDEKRKLRPYHKIHAVLGVMPRRLRLDDDEGHVDGVPFVVVVVGEALLPVDHEADGRGTAQESHEAQGQEHPRSEAPPPDNPLRPASWQKRKNTEQ